MMILVWGFAKMISGIRWVQATPLHHAMIFCSANAASRLPTSKGRKSPFHMAKNENRVVRRTACHMLFAADKMSWHQTLKWMGTMYELDWLFCCGGLHNVNDVIHCSLGAALPAYSLSSDRPDVVFHRNQEVFVLFSAVTRLHIAISSTWIRWNPLIVTIASSFRCLGYAGFAAFHREPAWYQGFFFWVVLGKHGTVCRHGTV